MPTLIVAPNWIGDALMAQPLLARLKEKRPGDPIDVLAPAWVAPVVRRMPEVNEVIVTPFRHGALQLGSRWRLGRSLRARGYDHAIVLPNSWKAALTPFFAGVPLRSGYVGEARYGLLNLLYKSNGKRAPMALHYARLADAPGSEPPQPLASPRLNVSAEEADTAAQRFGLEKPYAVFCPGAEYGPAKRWPAERFGALAARLPMKVALLGSEKDRPVCDAVGPLALNLAGRTTLDEAIGLIAGAAFVVTNDSGLMHVAAALERPQVAVFGSSSPAHTPPLSPAARVVWLAIECSPCFQRECPLGHFRCMLEIDVERVVREIQALGILPARAQ